jgi:leucyl-tRNA synthetase
MEYGTGAIMAVPAHDQRDFLFARQHGLPVKVVIQPEGQPLDPAALTEAYVADGVQVGSGPFDGLPNREAMTKIAEWMESKGIGSGWSISDCATGSSRASVTGAARSRSSIANSAAKCRCPRTSCP